MPTGAELSAIIIAADSAGGVVLKYLVAASPANISTENDIRTENDGNPAVASSFPNAQSGDVLATLLADMNGVPSGVRWMRDDTQ